MDDNKFRINDDELEDVAGGGVVWPEKPNTRTYVIYGIRCMVCGHKETIARKPQGATPPDLPENCPKCGHFCNPTKEYAFD